MRFRHLAIAMVLGLAAPNVALATTSITPKAQGSTGWSMDFCLDSVTGNLRQCTYIMDPATALPISPFPAGGVIGNTAFGINGSLPAYAATPTFNLGTIGAASTAALQPTNAGQGSTTNGQTGYLIEGAVTTAPPTYGNGLTQPFSLDTAGNVRVNIMAGAAAGGTSSNFAAAFPAAGTAMGVKNGANMVNLAADGSSNLLVNCNVGCQGGSTSNAVDAVATSATNGAVVSWLYGWNGTGFDRLQVDASKNLKVNLAAGSTVTVIGRTTMSLQTPVVTSNGAYTPGQEIGGKMTFPVTGAVAGGELKSITVTSKSIIPNMTLVAYVFTGNPTATTWTNASTPAINTADISLLLCAIPLNVGYAGLGTMSVWNVGNLGYQFAGANLYVVLVAGSGGTLTSASTSDFTVQLESRVD